MKTSSILRWVLVGLRWILLIPSYLLIVAFYAVTVMSLFESYKDAWRGHLDLILFFFSVMEAVMLCLFSIWMAPAYKTAIGVLAIVATIGLSLNRWSLVIAANGFTGPIIAEQIAYLIGGALVFAVHCAIPLRRRPRRMTATT